MNADQRDDQDQEVVDIGEGDIRKKILFLYCKKITFF